MDAPTAVLHYVSDRTGWWNLYVDDGGAGRALAPTEAEFAEPDWTLGQSSLVFFADGTVVVTWHADGRDHLGSLSPGSAAGRGRRCRTPRSGAWPRLDGAVVAVAASPTESPAVVRIAVPSGDVEVLKRAREPDGRAGLRLGARAAIEFPTEDGLTAHALFYRPANRDFVGPDGERPPLVVVSHGGPTGATDVGAQPRDPVLDEPRLRAWST